MKRTARPASPIHKTSEAFAARFGYACPEDLQHFYAAVSQEDRDWLALCDLEDVVGERGRDPRLPPGFVPIASEANGDWYCLRRLWQGPDGRTPVVLWLNDTGAFVPVSSDFRSFAVWKCFREGIESPLDERPLIQKRLARIRMASGFDGIYIQDRFHPLEWNDVILRADPTNAFQLCVSAWRKAKICRHDDAQSDIARAQAALPQFGGGHFVAGRILALRGFVREAAQAFWRFLQCPVAGSGHTHWTDWGDLEVPLDAERPAARFLVEAQTEVDRAVLADPKVRMLTGSDPKDARVRLKLAQQLAATGDLMRALVELENALFLADRDTRLVDETLLRQRDIYARLGALPEAQQCDRIRLQLAQG